MSILLLEKSVVYLSCTCAFIFLHHVVYEVFRLGHDKRRTQFRRRYSDRCPRPYDQSEERVQILNKYIVNGGHPLYGEVTISGAKNAAVAIIPAALMVDGVCRIENIPQISDVTLFFSILMN